MFRLNDVAPVIVHFWGRASAFLPSPPCHGVLSPPLKSCSPALPLCPCRHSWFNPHCALLVFHSFLLGSILWCCSCPHSLPSLSPHCALLSLLLRRSGPTFSNSVVCVLPLFSASPLHQFLIPCRPVLLFFLVAPFRFSLLVLLFFVSQISRTAFFRLIFHEFLSPASPSSFTFFSLCATSVLALLYASLSPLGLSSPGSSFVRPPLVFFS